MSSALPAPCVRFSRSVAGHDSAEPGKARGRPDHARQMACQPSGGLELTLEAPTKDRYKEFLLGKVPMLRFPTADEEQADPAAADGAYRSAVRWQVDNTKSVKRVQQENIAYGFRRNLYGLKPWGLLAVIAAAVIAGVVLWLRHGMDIEAIPAEAQVVFAVDAVVLPIMWTIAIRSAWGASAVDGYALALFGFCDQAERCPAREK